MALIAVLAIPVSRSARTVLLLIVIGFAVCWVLTSGLGYIVGRYD